jgi:hypothetical protein
MATNTTKKPVAKCTKKTLKGSTKVENTKLMARLSA